MSANYVLVADATLPTRVYTLSYIRHPVNILRKGENNHKTKKHHPTDSVVRKRFSKIISQAEQLIQAGAETECISELVALIG